MNSNTLRDAHKPHKTRFGAVSLGFSVTFAALHSQKTPRMDLRVNSNNRSAPKISAYLQIQTKYAKISPFLKIRQAEGRRKGRHG
ncbi:hypothetical protein D3Z50_07980 [Clostridiaceae bacterium]|nr:hypothetical protein [Clostridiaceae bacterium]